MLLPLAALLLPQVQRYTAVQRQDRPAHVLAHARRQPGFHHSHHLQMARQRRKVELVHPGTHREQDLEVGKDFFDARRRLPRGKEAQLRRIGRIRRDAKRHTRHLAQGRLCGLTVTELMARERGVSPAEVGYYRLRFPIKPITLGELASLPQTDASRLAVVRLAEEDAP